MNQAWVRSATRRPAKVVIHIDIWEAIFDQLAILEHHRTLTTLWTSSPSTESPQTTQPYINYLRHLGFLNLLSVKNFINFLHPHFMTAALQQTNHQNLNSTNDQDIIVADQITAKTPSIGVLALRFPRDLCRVARRRDLRVMLKRVKTLSLVSMEDLDASAAEVLTKYLPRLSGIELVQASVPHTSALASFLSHPKPRQLRDFSCSINRIQVPVLRAIPKQTNLQKLSLKFLIHLPVEMHRRPLSLVVKRRTLLGRFAPSYLITDPATENIKNMLRFVVVYSREQNYRGEIWTGNGYEFDEERMLVQLWDDIRGSAEALQLLRGSGPYPPFLGLMENTGARIASCD
ncbi:hypothetical protein CGRA01v4_06400 [Colletotrichum graminicola]|nr:hypothetical protein CGRA01v4_06400 [Colletotrichum graminicola]